MGEKFAEGHPCGSIRDPARGRLIPTSTLRIAQETKLTKNRLESLALQNELLAFSGFAGLRIFATFLRLDQADPPLKSRAPRTQNSLRTIGWSEASSLKVMNASSRS